MVSNPARVTLVVLLLVEAAGALLLTLLNVVTSQALGQDLLPWQSSLLPGGFGVLCLVAVVALARGKGWGTVLAVAVSLMVLGGGVLGLIYSGHPVLWVGVALGIGGLGLARLVASGEVASGETV
jgi:hypothetical protein